MKRVIDLKVLGACGLLSIIACLHPALFAAPPAAPPANKTPVQSATTLPAVSTTSAPAKSAPAARPAVVAPKASPVVSVMPGAGQNPLLQLKLAPQKEIFSNHEGLVMQFIFTAKARTKLCLDKDILTQTQVSIFQSGMGKLPLKPIVIKDNSHLFMAPMQVVWLDAGQSLTVRANLKRFQFDGGANWMPGEYNVDATFDLCEQTPMQMVTDPGHETPVKASRQGWFMIIE